MNQPKFKFGDKLQDTRDGSEIVVTKIKQIGDTYIYADGLDTVVEKCAELVCEPKKKKLYAYYLIDRYDAVIFKRSENHNDPRAMMREPEYDIEYPTKEEK